MENKKWMNPEYLVFEHNNWEIYVDERSVNAGNLTVVNTDNNKVIPTHRFCETIYHDQVLSEHIDSVLEILYRNLKSDGSMQLSELEKHRLSLIKLEIDLRILESKHNKGELYYSGILPAYPTLYDPSDWCGYRDTIYKELYSFGKEVLPVLKKHAEFFENDEKIARELLIEND